MCSSFFWQNKKFQCRCWFYKKKIAIKFAEAGSHVVCVARTPDTIKAVADEIQSNGAYLSDTIDTGGYFETKRLFSNGSNWYEF